MDEDGVDVMQTRLVSCIVALPGPMLVWHWLAAGTVQTMYLPIALVRGHSTLFTPMSLKKMELKRKRLRATEMVAGQHGNDHE
jgi:hypothetical protein